MTRQQGRGHQIETVQPSFGFQSSAVEVADGPTFVAILTNTAWVGI